MINRMLIYLRLTKIDTSKINSLLQEEDYDMICLALKRSNHKIRNQLLLKLQTKKFINHHRLKKHLLRIVATDFFSVAQIAIDVLNENVKKDETRICEQANLIFTERLRKKKNLEEFYKNHHFKMKRKSLAQVEMRQLELVKNQLKKSIRLW